MPLFFFLIKRTKNQVIREASFAAQALCAKAVKPRARSFCRRLSHSASASGNPDSYRDTNARAAAQSHLVLPPFARSCPYDENEKEAQWPVSTPGREYGLAGGSDRADLIFWLLLYQDKSNSLRGN
jgi:hypothetical protein